MNVGITLALILTIILITVYAYRSFKWLISKIRLAIATHVQAVAVAIPEDDDDSNDESYHYSSESDDDDSDGEADGDSNEEADGVSDGTEGDDGLTQAQNEGTHHTTTNDAESDASHDDESDEHHVTNDDTEEPHSSPSGNEGVSPVTSESSILGPAERAALLRAPLMPCPSAPLQRRPTESSSSQAIGSRPRRASSFPGSSSESSGSTVSDPVDLTDGSRSPARARMYDGRVVYDRPLRRPAPAPPRVLPPPVQAPPPVAVLPPALVVPPVPPPPVPHIRRVDERAPNTMRENIDHSAETLAIRNFRATQYASMLVTVSVGDRRDLSTQTGIPRDVLECPRSVDPAHAAHVWSFADGLQRGVIPFHYEARFGHDEVTGLRRDAPARLSYSNARNNLFETWVLATHGVNLSHFPPANQPLPPAWRSSMLYIYLHDYIDLHVAGSRLSAGTEGARFNIWHCWLYERYVRFFPLLRRFQEPVLELHLLISNQSHATDDRRKRTQRNQAAAQAKRSRTR
jgi:hypothetical protein